MSEIIDLGKTTFSRKNFEKVVDNRFKQLLNNRAAVDEIFTINDFFQLYDDLFYQIPKEGEIQSHRFILNQTAEYLGISLNDGTDIQALLDEITTLRSELLTVNQTLVDSVKK
jgi:hypothetical protein